MLTDEDKKWIVAEFNRISEIFDAELARIRERMERAIQTPPREDE